MEARQRWAILGGVVVVAVIAVLLLVPRAPQGQVDARRLFEAIQGYTQQARASGTPVPATVALQELLARGLLQPQDVSGFDGMEVTVALKADPTDPDAVLMEARAPDGYRIVLLVDGRVLTYAK
ncbi:MAG: hypothetical protein KIS67_03425 [Verrucomicrobiae bacterium]|nr:hypothetical protein [Verrucomicrobiae bacterium]